VPLFGFVAILTVAIPLRAEDWPSWRGTTGMGHTSEKELPLTWGGKDGEQKRPDVGFAHSTPVLAPIRGKMQMLVAASNALQGLDPATGVVL
jgi:hypothetical protein